MAELLPVHTACSTCPIRHQAVCASCDADELVQLNAFKYYKSYVAGQNIALRGDALDMVASVVTGTAALERVTEDGRVQMVGLMLPSDFIGRPGRTGLKYDVLAVSDVTLCCFKRKPFEAMLECTPHLSERLLDMALDELDAARDWMLLLGRKTAREKITSFLDLILKRTTLKADIEAGGPVHITLPISRESMANFLGLTIETVSRQLTALKTDGLIAIEGKRSVTIPDVGALRSETGDDEDDI